MNELSSNIPNLFHAYSLVHAFSVPLYAQIFRYKTFPNGPIHLVLTSAHSATSLLQSFKTTVSTFCGTKIWLCRQISAGVLVKLQSSPLGTSPRKSSWRLFKPAVSTSWTPSLPFCIYCHFNFFLNHCLNFHIYFFVMQWTYDAAISVPLNCILYTVGVHYRWVSSYS